MFYLLMGKVLLRFAGVFALMTFVLWIISLIIFTFGDMQHTGDIAYIPKWVFAFSLFALLPGDEEIFYEGRIKISLPFTVKRTVLDRLIKEGVVINIDGNRGRIIVYR